MNVFLECIIPNKLVICCVPIIWCRVVVCLRVTLLVLFRTCANMCVSRLKIVVISVSYLSFLSIMFLGFMSTLMVNKCIYYNVATAYAFHYFLTGLLSFISIGFFLCRMMNVSINSLKKLLEGS